MRLSEKIPRHLNETGMKMVSMLNHLKGIDPLSIDILFVELHLRFFFIRQVNRGGD